MVLKRKQSSLQATAKKQRKTPSPAPLVDDVVSDTDAEIFGNGTLLDPMIDPQYDSDEEDDDDDDEEEAGEEEATGASKIAPASPAGVSAPTAGPSRSRGLFKPPTLEELDKLRSAEQSGGNTFSLQLDALLTSTLLSTTPAPALKTLLGAIHDLVHSLPTLSPVSPRTADARLGKGKIPFPGPKGLSPLVGEEPKWTLGWDRPAEVVVGGSWAVCAGYKRAKGEAGNVDIVVVMPQDMFSAKDRMGYRYFHKRVHYLAVIAEAIRRQAKKSSSALYGVSVSWDDGADARRPIVVVSAGKEQGLKHSLDIRVHASVATETFPLSTLCPTKSLIRSDSDDTTPTPQIASSLVRDMLYKPHLLHLHRLSSSLSTGVGGSGTDSRVADKFLALWRIWAARRGISRARGGSGWFASMLLGWVVDGGDIGGVTGDRAQTKRARGLGRGLGPWSALRAAWEFLAHTDFEATPVFIAGDQGIPRTEFIQAFSDVFVDPTGTLNILGDWERGDVAMLRQHARETLAMLEDDGVDRFADVFIHDHTLGSTTYDEYLTVDTTSADDVSATLVELAEHPRSVDRLALRAARVLRSGLTTRARIVHVHALTSTSLGVGLVFDASLATRVLDLGPAADSVDTLAGPAFRELWGDRAELRRFKDGSIAESVVWPTPRPEDAALIPVSIVSYLVERHLGVDSSATVSRSVTPEWLQILQVPASARDAVVVSGSEKLGFRPVMDAYETLYKLLKSIDSELPLAVLHVAPASDMLRYAAVFVPHPFDLARAASAPDSLSHLPVAEVTLQFESSQRWPDDLAAIQKLKLALLEKLARVVTAHLRGVRVAIALDADASEIDDAASLELTLPQGVAFRVRIHHERERTLLERALEPPPAAAALGNSLPQPHRKLVVPALERHAVRFIHRPAHHSSIAPMHHRFPSFSTAARLLKRWSSAHMLAPHLTVEALELVTAHTYLDPGALAPPASATAGFLRTLTFLAAWDWRTEPVFVPLAAASRDAATASGRPRFPTDARTAARESFEKRRGGADSHLAWALVTDEDLSGTRWTSRVSPVIAARVSALAQASLALVRTSVSSSSSSAAAAAAKPLDVTSLFKTPTEHYDAVLHLVPDILPRLAQGVDVDSALWESKLSFRNLTATAGERTTLRVDFDPATLLVRDIERAYGDALLVFHDTFGGRLIGLVWNPARAVPRSLKPFLGYSSMPAPSEAALVELNKSAVLAEIARLGAGIIERIETR